jgi:P-type Cu+ transporter
LLRLAASAERGSEHPLGEAIVRAAQEKGLVLSEPTGFESIAGHGIAAHRWMGHDVLLGNLRLMTQQDVALNGLEAKAESCRRGQNAMWLAVDGQASALIGVADTIKDGSKEASALQSAGSDSGHDDRRQRGHRPGHCRRSGH